MSAFIPIRIPLSFRPATALQCLCAAAVVWLTILPGSSSALAGVAPYATTQLPGPITATNATLGGMVTPNGLPTLAWFDWGTNAALGTSTSGVEVGDGSGVRRVTALIEGLAAHTTYHYRLASSNAAGVTRGAGKRFTTGLRVRAWGNNSNYQTNVPATLTDAVAIAAGNTYGVAVKNDGTLRSWGSSFYLPPNVTNVIAVALGNGNLALQADGTVLRWSSTMAVPVGSNGVAIAAWSPYWILLHNNGTVTTMPGRPAVPAGLSNVVAVAASSSAGLALRDNGTVAAWGSSFHGQTNVPPGLTNVVELAAGQSHVLALRADGTVTAWGRSNYGETNVPPGLSNVVAIAAGYYTSLALKADGSLVAWGLNSTYNRIPPAGMTNCVAIATGNGFDVALANQPPLANNLETQARLDLDAVIPLSGSDPDGDPLRYRITALPAAGSLFQYTTNGRGAPILTTPADVLDGKGRVILAPATGGFTNLLTTLSFVANDGLADSLPASVTIQTFSQPFAFTLRAAAISEARATLHGMANPCTWPTVAWFEYGATTDYGSSTPATTVGGGSAVGHLSATISGLAPQEVFHYRLVASNRMGVAYGMNRLFTTGRKVAAWGENWYGQTDIPPSLTNVTAIAAGDAHGLALTTTGEVVGWGSQQFGAATVPAGLTNVASVTGAGGHGLAVLKNGHIVGWGNNTYGQSTPPAGLSNVVAVAGGASHSVALSSDGSVLAWGDNRYGQTNVPAGLSNVVAISASGYHSLALRHNGTVAAWGTNVWDPPWVPAGLSSVTAVAAGFWHNLALKADGTVAGWMGTTSVSGQARPPVGLSNVVAVSGGGFHSLALTVGGGVVAWGSNQAGEAMVPVGLDQGVDVSAGPYYSLALAPNVPPTVSPLSVTGATNEPILLTLPAGDVNSDPLTLKIISLPLQGGLFQFASNGLGAPILAPGTPVTDAGRQVIFVPAADDMGSPYATFAFTASDGEAESPSATVTVHVMPRPQIEGSGFNASAGNAFELHFSGLPGAAYSVQASTNLVNWQRLSSAVEVTNGWFQFSDTQTNRPPRRFYRVTLP